MQLKDLRDGMKSVSVVANVTEKSDARRVEGRFSSKHYDIADVTVSDETGAIKLTLWNEQIEQVNVGDTLKIENGYISSFKGVIQLNVGKFGKMTVTRD